MFPIINFLLFIIYRRARVSRYLVYIYVLVFAIFLSLVKNHLYDDDFYGYFQHYQNFIFLGEIPYYSEGREFVLSVLMMTLGLLEIDSIFVFSLFFKLIIYSIIVLFLKKYEAGGGGVFLIVMIAASPNFIMYTDSFIRQSISLALVLLSVTMTIKYRFIIFLIAIFTHLSTILYVPILLFHKIRFNHLLVLLVVSYVYGGLDYSYYGSIANFFGMTDKLYFTDQLYVSGVVDTRPSVMAFLPALLIIAVSKISNRDQSAKDQLLTNIFMWSIIMGNLVSEIPYASSRISMLTMAYTSILLVLLKGRILIVMSLLINGYLWIRFALRENPTMELNYQYLIWPFGINI